MAEFCRKCFLELIYSPSPSEEIVMTDYDDFCEGCGEVGPVVDSIAQSDSGKRQKNEL